MLGSHFSFLTNRLLLLLSVRISDLSPDRKKTTPGGDSMPGFKSGLNTQWFSRPKRNPLRRVSSQAISSPSLDQNKLTLPISFELSQVRSDRGDKTTEIGCMTDVVTDE